MIKEIKYRKDGTITCFTLKQTEHMHKENNDKSDITDDSIKSPIIEWWKN